VQIEAGITGERQKRIDEDTSIRKELTSKVHSVMNAIEQDRMRWESAMESASITQSKHSKDMQDQLEKVRKKLKQSIEDQSLSFAEKMREQAHELQGQRTKHEASRDEWFSRVETIASSTRATALQGDTEIKTRLSQFERSVDDHIWQLKQTIENEVIERVESVREVASTLESGSQRTEQDIQTLTVIMEDSIRRMHEGIEKDE
jgi:alpha-amylase/alpha-mannosidase (GH57 family)